MRNTIADNLQAIKDCKEDIRQAIEECGVEVLPSTPLGDYANKIKEISSLNRGFINDTNINT